MESDSDGKIRGCVKNKSRAMCMCMYMGDTIRSDMERVGVL